MAGQKWDLDRFNEGVRRNQARRWLVCDAIGNTQYFPRDYQPIKQASESSCEPHESKRRRI